MVAVAEREDEGLLRLTREEYHAMPDNGRTELLDGLVFTLMGQSGRHFSTWRRLAQLLVAGLEPGSHIRTQGPILTSSDGEPEPDVAIVKGSPEDYTFENPASSDVLFIAEVSDHTLRKDRGRKAAAYARAAIPEYWIVDLVHDLIEKRTNPTPTGYRTVETYRRGEEIDGLSVDEILGPEEPA
ncbi:Uma2 family endonuclease [soil metagenome]